MKKSFFQKDSVLKMFSLWKLKSSILFGVSKESSRVWSNESKLILPSTKKSSLVDLGVSGGNGVGLTGSKSRLAAGGVTHDVSEATCDVTSSLFFTLLFNKFGTEWIFGGGTDVWGGAVTAFDVAVTTSDNLLSATLSTEGTSLFLSTFSLAVRLSAATIDSSSSFLPTLSIWSFAVVVDLDSSTFGVAGVDAEEATTGV